NARRAARRNYRVRSPLRSAAVSHRRRGREEFHLRRTDRERLAYVRPDDAPVVRRPDKTCRQYGLARHRQYPLAEAGPAGRYAAGADDHHGNARVGEQARPRIDKVELGSVQPKRRAGHDHGWRGHVSPARFYNVSRGSLRTLASIKIIFGGGVRAHDGEAVVEFIAVIRRPQVWLSR